MKDSTKHFDSSHNHEHAEKVYASTIAIMNTLFADPSSYDVELITYAALLHDVRDHKYPESISEQELNEFIYNAVGKEKGDHVLLIIENVSFSKEDKLRKATEGKLNISEAVPTDLHPYLIALRDADRLEAIG